MSAGSDKDNTSNAADGVDRGCSVDTQTPIAMAVRVACNRELGKSAGCTYPTCDCQQFPSAIRAAIAAHQTASPPEDWKDFCVIDVMIRNPHVDEFVRDRERQIERLHAALAPFVAAYNKSRDPGTSDLDNEQPFNLRVLLGDCRHAAMVLPFTPKTQPPAKAGEAKQ